jgi:predicted short-subunit dehydrogenase-like oxidoreductase (DUF2520 family)
MMNHVAADLHASRFLNLIGGDPKDRAAIDNFGGQQTRWGFFLPALFRALGRCGFCHVDNIKHVSPSVILPGMQRKPSIAIVGPGNLGSALAISLVGAGFKVKSVIPRSGGKSLAKARRLAKQVGAHATESADNSTAQVVWFCVPDSEIASAARSLVKKVQWTGRVALHSSGVLSSGELDSLRRKGAAVASVHPLMTFVGKSLPALHGVPFAIEGDAAAVRVARSILKVIGGQAYAIRKRDKAAYHAWGTFASPLLTALLATTEQVAKLAGVRPEEARRRMIPILGQTLANYEQFGAARGFSGPIIRGDVDTVKRHLRVLDGAPAAKRVYVALALAALEYLPAGNRKALRRALGE